MSFLRIHPLPIPPFSISSCAFLLGGCAVWRSFTSSRISLSASASFSPGPSRKHLRVAYAAHTHHHKAQILKFPFILTILYHSLIIPFLPVLSSSLGRMILEVGREWRTMFSLHCLASTHPYLYFFSIFALTGLIPVQVPVFEVMTADCTLSFTRLLGWY